MASALGSTRASAPPSSTSPLINSNPAARDSYPVLEIVKNDHFMPRALQRPGCMTTDVSSTADDQNDHILFPLSRAFQALRLTRDGTEPSASTAIPRLMITEELPERLVSRRQLYMGRIFLALLAL